MGDTFTTTATVDILWAYAFFVPATQHFDRIAIHVTVGSSIGWENLARLGIYSDNGNCYPSSLVLDAGTVDVTTSGLKTLTIDLTLTRGLYWLVYVTDAKPSLGGQHPRYVYAPIGTLGPYGQPHNAWSIFYSLMPLPATFPAGAISSPETSVMALRKS